MTVRAWFTISALVLVALAAALFVQFTRPVAPPGIVAKAGDVRLAGVLETACWPQRSGDLRCEHHPERNAPARTVARSGRLRFVFAYPAEPKTGFIRITDTRGGNVVLRSGWKRALRYSLDPGGYTVIAQAGDRSGAYVRYVFRLTVTRSGS